MRALDLIASAFDLQGRELHRALAQVWGPAYKSEFETLRPDAELDDVRAYCRDVGPDSFVTLLRVAYRHGLADGRAGK